MGWPEVASLKRRIIKATPERRRPSRSKVKRDHGLPFKSREDKLFFFSPVSVSARFTSLGCCAHGPLTPETGNSANLMPLDPTQLPAHCRFSNFLIIVPSPNNHKSLQKCQFVRGQAVERHSMKTRTMQVTACFILEVIPYPSSLNVFTNGNSAGLSRGIERLPS